MLRLEAWQSAYFFGKEPMHPLCDVSHSLSQIEEIFWSTSSEWQPFYSLGGGRKEGVFITYRYANSSTLAGLDVDQRHLAVGGLPIPNPVLPSRRQGCVSLSSIELSNVDQGPLLSFPIFVWFLLSPSLVFVPTTTPLSFSDRQPAGSATETAPLQLGGIVQLHQEHCCLTPRSLRCAMEEWTQSGSCHMLRQHSVWLWAQSLAE